MANIADLWADGAQKYSSAAGENSHLISSTQAVLYGFDGRNTDASNAVYIMVFDTATAPTAASIPVITIGVPSAGTGATIADGNYFYNCPTVGVQFSKGIAIAASSTDAPSYTAVATSKTIFHVQYAHEDGTSAA